jgi:hypothetical protein
MNSRRGVLVPRDNLARASDCWFAQAPHQRSDNGARRWRTAPGATASGRRVLSKFGQDHHSVLAMREGRANDRCLVLPTYSASSASARCARQARSSVNKACARWPQMPCSDLAPIGRPKCNPLLPAFAASAWRISASIPRAGYRRAQLQVRNYCQGALGTYLGQNR